MLTRTIRFTLALFLPLIFISTMALTAPLSAQEIPAWQTVAGDFVREILNRGGSPSAVLVSFENISSSPAADLDSLKRAVLDNFQKAGVRLVKPEFALAEIRITFSEDWQDHVWVAEIRQGPASQTVIRRFAKLPKTTSSRAPLLTIRKNLVWQQEGPILDFAMDGPNLFVLEPDQLTIYINDGGKWRARETLAISHDRAWPRDLRGRIHVSGSQITAYFPGTLCTGSGSPPALQCRNGDDPWQLDQGKLAAFFSPARNFFTGVLAGQSAGESVPPFFSGAVLETSDSRQWIFAGIDGHARIYLNNLASPVAIVNNRGSDIAAVQSNCGSGKQILVSAPGDLTRNDSLEAVEIQNREAVPVSSASELSGPLIALWPGENGMVHGIVLSLATGRYEAWSFGVGCG
jgi:hypothetical protein